MRKIVICDDMELERLLLKDILIQYFEEIRRKFPLSNIPPVKCSWQMRKKGISRENCSFWIFIWIS